LRKQVPGYQPNAPVDHVLIVDTIPDSTVFDTKFQKPGCLPKHDPDDVMDAIKIRLILKGLLKGENLLELLLLLLVLQQVQFLGE
jgi:hypothetical protein